MTETHPAGGTINFEITRSPNTEGFLYTVFVESKEEVTIVASGQEERLDNIFNIIKNVTERTL